MKRIACLFFAQLLAANVASGFTPPAGVAAPHPAAGRGPVVARAAASDSSPVQDEEEEDTDEECAKKAKEFVENMKEVEQGLDPIEDAVNAQMGGSGPRLNVPRWRSVFTKTRGRTQERLAAQGVFLAGFNGKDTEGVLTFIKDSFLELVGTLEWWDQDTEKVWAEDLLADGLAANEEAAKKEAEAMGDRRLHWYMENDILRTKIAEWYHNYELVQDKRQCLARQHQKRKDRRPSSIGQDFRTQSTSRMVPNDTFIRGAPSKADCQWVETESNDYDEDGNWIGITVHGQWICQW